MNIKRSIDKNYKLIWYVVIIIIFILFVIKILNSYYEKEENKRQIQLNDEIIKEQAGKNQNIAESDYTTESNSIEITIGSFVNYCNKRELDKAYQMLTDECKKEMFSTIEEFERIYINNVYNVKRVYELLEWTVEENRYTYQVKLYGDILSTGNVGDFKEEYYTLIQDDNGNYKLNVNNYIYGENRNIESTVKDITIKIGKVDIYDEYEKAEITITNNSSKTICLTGNKYEKNIYLLNYKETKYSSLDGTFDNQEIIIKPNNTKTFTVKFNKTYSPSNKAIYLQLSDVILDYQEYLTSEDKDNYSNRTSIKVQY